jgi:adenylate kinase family enzyme
MKKTKVINLFGPPGTGKSTTAADTFAKFKWHNKSCELIGEYAKQLVWEGRTKILSDNQVYVTAKQNLSVSRLIGKVEYILTDSPILLGLVYFDNKKHLELANLIKRLYSDYDNLNILLRRTKPYHKEGRYQTEEESNNLAGSIENLLIENQLDYITIDADEDAKNKIYNHVFGVT